jgi:hypothetical protein
MSPRPTIKTLSPVRPRRQRGQRGFPQDGLFSMSIFSG